jgi:hypothetical protein
MRREWGWVLGGLLAGTAVAADQGTDPSSGAASAGAAVSHPSAQIEATMSVTGTLLVDATGATTGFTLDKRDRLPPPVTQLLDQVLPTFRFKPVEHDGHPVAVETKMCVEVVANQIDPKHIALRLRSARFVEAETPTTNMAERISVNHRVPMSYPPAANQASVQGTVYLALRIDRTGHVADIEVQQVNLRRIGTDGKMQHWRDILADNAVAGARQFTFNVPTAGKHAHDAFFAGILPVEYSFADVPQAGYGQWSSYVPGPKRDIAWLHNDGDDNDIDDGNNNATLPAGEFASSGDSLKLLTPLGGG